MRETELIYLMLFGVDACAENHLQPHCIPFPLVLLISGLPPPTGLLFPMQALKKDLQVMSRIECILPPITHSLSLFLQ